MLFSEPQFETRWFLSIYKQCFFFSERFSRCHSWCLVLFLKDPSSTLSWSNSLTHIYHFNNPSYLYFFFISLGQVCFSCYWCSLLTISALFFATSDEGFNVAPITFLILEVMLNVTRILSHLHCLFLWFNYPLKFMKRCNPGDLPSGLPVSDFADEGSSRLFFPWCIRMQGRFFSASSLSLSVPLSLSSCSSLEAASTGWMCSEL